LRSIHVYFHTHQIIASAIPALSGATGRTAIFDEYHAFDMNTNYKPEGGAWGRDDYPYFRRWLHNDIWNMAYLYTHRLFAKLVELGGLQ
jgi:hypothetical protein